MQTMEKYPESNKKSLHYHPLHEVFFVFDEGISVMFENGIKEYKNFFQKSFMQKMI